MLKTLLSAAILAAATLAPTAQAHDASANDMVTPAFRHALPNLPGKSLTAVVVSYEPTAASPAHTHAGSAFVWAYVLSGAIRSQVDDGPVKVYRTGESW